MNMEPMTETMHEIAVYGAGGLGREICCLLRRINAATDRPRRFVGFFDDGLPSGSSNDYGPVLGGLERLNAWERPLEVVVAVGSPEARRRIVEGIRNPRISFPNLMSPDTLFLDRRSLRIGRGNVFCARCLVSCHVTIGDFNLFNGYITVGHDLRMGDCNVVMPSVNLSGGVTVGDGNLFGVGSVVLQGLSVGSGVRLGAGSVLMRRAVDGALYVGNPAIKMKV